MTQAKLRTDPSLVVALELASPETKARLNAPPASAPPPSPIEKPRLNGPVAVATAPSPMAKEALNNVLVQPVADRETED